MALTRQAKEELLASYSEGFAQSPHAFLVDFKGISVPQATELRSQLRANGGSYVVVKNRLALLAVKDTSFEELSAFFDGPTAVAYSDGDAVGLAKALTTFAKDVPAIEFKGGLVDGNVVAADDIKKIAELPSREELLAKLVFLLQSPIVRLATGLNAITRQFVVVLEQVRLKKEETAGA